MTRRYLVSGLVQGVGFRWFAYRHARRLRLTGYVRNRPDGTVEVVAAGEPADLAALEKLLRAGPDHARVDRVEASELDPAPSGAAGGAHAAEFEIR
jgi:acylphosphatase